MPAPIFPPADKNPWIKIGVVHGAWIYIVPAKPMEVKKYAVMDVATGAKTNGIAINGFMTIGRPKTIGSLMLKMAQGSSSLAMER